MKIKSEWADNGTVIYYYKRDIGLVGIEDSVGRMVRE